MGRTKGSKNTTPTANEMYFLTSLALDDSIEILTKVCNETYSEMSEETQNSISHLLTAYLNIKDNQEKQKHQKIYQEYIDFIEHMKRTRP